MSDVEREIAEALREALGVRCLLEVPEQRPGEFVSVEQVGEQGHVFTRDVTLAVQSWAQTRRRAAEIAGLVEGATPGLMGLGNVFRAVATATYRYPDPDSRQERYQTTLELTICE